MSAVIEMCRNHMTNLLSRATRALSQLSEEQINWRPNEASNSIANLVIHLEGNLQHFIEAGLGGAASRRNRDLEFNSREAMTSAQAIERLTGAVERARTVLAGVAPEQLTATIPWNGRELSVPELVMILTVHLGEHVGQMLYIAKALQGDGYQVVSIPHTRR